jgi:hypothetical protein
VYQIRIRAKNDWGYGPFSTITSVKASSVPNKVAMPTTSIDGVTGGIRVNWVSPYANSEIIDKYLI